MRVKLTQGLKVAITGHEPVALAPGEHEVPHRVAMYIKRHPEYGTVIEPRKNKGKEED